MSGSVFVYIAFFLFLAVFFSIIARLVKGRFAPVKSVRATVTDKYALKSVITPGSFGGKGYVVVFSAEGKKLCFNVSEFTYPNYKVNKSGTLRYKGGKIIDFK